MHIVHVHIKVKPDQIEAFKSATLENARHSLKEPGIARFDLIQQQEDPSQFVLVEVYRTADDPAKHKQTAHYNLWRETAEPMMAAPRSRTMYTNLFPEDKDW